MAYALTNRAPGTSDLTAKNRVWGIFAKITRDTNNQNLFARSIGNRLKSSNSLTLPTSNNYTANTLNQYSSLSIPDPQSPIVNPSYDFDGNATSYPLPAHLTANSTLTWDGECKKHKRKKIQAFCRKLLL